MIHHNWLRPHLAAALILLTLSSCSWPFSSKTTTSSTATTSSPFSEMLLKLGSYGQSVESSFGIARGLAGGLGTSGPGTRALTSTADGATSYYAVLNFDLSSSSTLSGYASVLGYELYRSTDYSTAGSNATWTLVGRENLGTATRAVGLTASDVDSSLVLGTTYAYRVRAIYSADPSYSDYSPVLSASFLSPYTLSLASPAYSSSSTPTASLSTPLTFAVSDTGLWSASDYFNFALFIKREGDANTSPAFYGEFRYNFAKQEFEVPGAYSAAGKADWTTYKAAAGITYAGGTVTVDMAKACLAAYADPAFVTADLGLEKGATYEWDVYGRYQPAYGDLADAAAMDSAYFVKMGSVSEGSTNMAQAVSLSSTYTDGAGAKNGAFLFIAD